MNMMDKASGSSNETASAPTSSQESSQSIAKQNDDAVDSIIDSGDDDLPF